MFNANYMPIHDVPALIEWLETLYPERCPDPKDTEREVWMKAGERRVVRVLIAKLQNAEQKNLEGE
jgi:hypothetical protein